MINNSFRALASAVSTTVGQPSTTRAVLLLPNRYTSTRQNDHATGTENFKTNTIFIRALASKPPKGPGPKTSNPIPISSEKRPFRLTGSSGNKCANGKCRTGESTARSPSVSTEHTWREKIYTNGFVAREGLRSRAEMRCRSSSWGRSAENEPMKIVSPYKSVQTQDEDGPNRIPNPKSAMGTLLKNMDDEMTSSYDPIFGSAASLRIKESEKENQAKAQKERESQFCVGGVCRPKIIKSKNLKPGKIPSKGAGGSGVNYPIKYTSSRSVHSQGTDPADSTEPIVDSIKDIQSSPSPMLTPSLNADVNTENKSPDVSEKAAQPEGSENITPPQPKASKSITPSTGKKDEHVRLLEDTAFHELLKNGGNTNVTPNKPEVGHSRSRLPKEVRGGHPAIIERLKTEANLFVSTEKVLPIRTKLGNFFRVKKDLSKTDAKVVVHRSPEKAKKQASINKRKFPSEMGVGINRVNSGTGPRDSLTTSTSTNLPSKYKMNNVVKNVASSIEKKVISRESSVSNFLKRAKSTEGNFFKRNNPVSALKDTKEDKEAAPADSKNTAALNRPDRLPIFHFLKTAKSSDGVGLSIKKLVDKIKKH